jgi:carboxymethylenebutenolidase
MVDHIQENDPRLDVKDTKYPGATGDIESHQAKPKDQKKHPGVVIIHENRGLNPHTREVARRMALEGFLALAPNALTPVGGTPDDPDEARTQMQSLDPKETVSNFVAAIKYLKTHPDSTGKVGVTGFCWGGGMTNQVAVNSTEVDAAVPFYGRQPEPEDVPKIKAPVLAHYAEDDERINAGIPNYDKALNEAGIEHKFYTYKNTRHAFFNDTGTRYNEEASKLAWNRTIEFFKEKLK